MSVRLSVRVQVEMLALLRFLNVTKVQGMSREDSMKVQGFSREGSGILQEMFRKGSKKVQESFRKACYAMIDLNMTEICK